MLRARRTITVIRIPEEEGAEEEEERVLPGEGVAAAEEAAGEETIPSMVVNLHLTY